MSRCWFGYFWLPLSPSSSQSMICCMPVSPFPFKGRILPCNPSQLWQIARPIKGKLFGSAQTRWPHVAARPPLRSAFIPPGTSPLRVQGSRSLWVLPQRSGEGNMETADKQDNYPRLWLSVSPRTASHRGHRGYVLRPHLQRAAVSEVIYPPLRYLSSPCWSFRVVFLSVGSGWKLKPQGSHGADGGGWLWTLNKIHFFAAPMRLRCYCLGRVWTRGWVRMRKLAMELRNGGQTLASKGVLWGRLNEVINL